MLDFTAREALSTSEYNLNESLSPEVIQETVALTRSLEMLGRHEVRVQNAMHKALKELKALQAEARKESTAAAKSLLPSGFVPASHFSAASAAVENDRITSKDRTTDPPFQGEIAA